MNVYTFPVLCWQLTDELVCGRAIGPDLEIVRSDARKVLAALSIELGREGVRVSAPVTDYKRVRQTVSVRPSYRVDNQVFPLKDALQIPVDAVYGRNDFGSFTCFIPRFDSQFHYYEADNLKTLLEHFSQDALRSMSPEKLYRYLLAPAPWLESTKVREKAPKRAYREEPIETPRLSQAADRLPLPKKLVRKREGLPAAAWERAGSVRECAELFGKVNFLLVGEHGVGKTAILGEAVRKSAKSKGGPTFWKSAAHRLVAGAKYLGDWQQLCDALVYDLSRVRGVLWIEDFIELIRVGGSGPEDSVASFLTPALDRGDFHIVGEITPRGLDAARTALPGFVERFRLIRVEDMPEASVRSVMAQYGAYTEETLGVSLAPKARRLAYRLLDRHVRYEQFPAKALRFLAETAHNAELAQRSEVDEAAVMKSFIQRTGMPPVLVDDQIKLDASELRAWFERRIVGQPVAVEAVTSVIRTFKAGLNDPDKPIATLLFSGPTGVGKTALASALSDYFFGEGHEVRPLIRIDMSEFQHPGQLSRLIGTGSGEPGELVRKVRATPFSVVLFDEIEKASPIFFDTLLTVLDEGLLADAIGRETDFRGCIVIMTTNLGARKGAAPGFGTDAAQNIASDIRAFFRPEFFNRIDQVVPFSPLQSETIRAIARIELDNIRTREGLSARDLTLHFTDALVALVAARGFDEAYGARALQRVVEHQVVAALGRYLLANPQVQGARLTVDVAEGEVVVSGKQP